MPVVYHKSLRFAMVLMVIDCAPKPPQKRILDIATGDVTGVVWVVDLGSHCNCSELLAQQYGQRVGRGGGV